MGAVGADDGVAGLVVHALNATAAGVHVAHDGSGELVGNGDFDLHDGLEQGGLGGLHGFLEGDAAGGLEAQFVGIHVVIAAIVEADLEIDDGISGEEAAGGGFEDSLFDGGDEVFGDGAAEDVVDELELRAAGQGRHVDFAVAELAVSAGLLLVAALDVGGAADGFAVGHLGGLEDDLGVVAALELADDDLDVLLAGAGDEEVLGLRIAEEAQHGVLFHELVDADAEFVFVGAGLGLDGEGDGGLGQGDGRVLDGRGLVAQGVAGEGVLELGDGADVSGRELGDGDELLAQNGGDVGELFDRAAADSW